MNWNPYENSLAPVSMSNRVSKWGISKASQIDWMCGESTGSEGGPFF